MFLNSIRGRLLLWYGLILCVVVGGFGYGAYRLQRGVQLRDVDDKLRNRLGVLTFVLPRLARQQRGGGPMDGDAPPPPTKGFQLSKEDAAQFDDAEPHHFYYVLWRRDGPILAQSDNAPKTSKPEKPSDQFHTRRQGKFREMYFSTPPGEIVLVGCLTEPEALAAREMAWSLVGIGAAILLLGLIGGWYVASKAIQPIEQIGVAAEKISRGDLSQRVPLPAEGNELGADTPLTITSAAVNPTNYNVTLVWSSVEGGTYQVENSTNQSTWVTDVAGMSSQGTSTTTNYTNLTSGGTSYGRVTRTALATYDDAGGSSGVVGQTNTISYLMGNDAPTVANPIPNQTNTYGSSLSYTFPANTFSDIDSGQTLTYTASSSLLSNTGISFNPSTRTFSATAIDATNGGTIAGSYSVKVVATDNGTPAMTATNTFTWVINKASASVTPASTSRTYGATNPVFSGTLSGFVAADSITANYSSTATTNSAAGMLPINATLNDSGNRLGNYNVTTNFGILTIDKAPLSIWADSFSRAYGSTNPTFTYIFTGFKNNDTAATAVTGAPSLTTSATASSTVGNYTISNSIGSLSSANYWFGLFHGTLTVTQANLTVSVNDGSRIYGETNPTFSGTISGLLNNDDITAMYTSAANTNSSAGTYSIVPTFSDPNGKVNNYLVTTNAGTLTITPAPLLVSATAMSRSYGATNPVFTASYSGFVNGQTAGSGTVSGTPALASSAATNSPVGDYAILVGRGTMDSQDYSLTFTQSTLTVTQAVLTVTPASFNRAYGQANPTFTGTLSGVMNNDNISANYSTTATASSPVGAYPITATLSDPASLLSNYSVTTNQGTLTITNGSISSTYTVSFLQSNSLILQAKVATTNYTFIDTNSGLSIVVAVSMTPYSTTNANPAFTLLDNVGSIGRAGHLGVNSGASSGDGNWMDYYEGANFAASLVSVSPGIDTNSIQFAIAQIGLRPSNGSGSGWNSSVGTNFIHFNGEKLYAADTNTYAMTNGPYSAQFRVGNAQLQMSDEVNTNYNGLVVQASFFVGSQTVQGGPATLGRPTYSSGQVQVTVSGTSGANYIVQSSTDLTNWVSVMTNAAPFTFTESVSSTQKFYRAMAQ